MFPSICIDWRPDVLSLSCSGMASDNEPAADFSVDSFDQDQLGKSGSDLTYEPFNAEYMMMVRRRWLLMYII